MSNLSLTNLCPIGFLFVFFRLLMGPGVCYGQALTATATATSNCSGFSLVSVTATGGSPTTYTFSIDGSAPQASNIFINIMGPTHTITVNDGVSPTVTINLTIDCIDLTNLSTTTTASTCGASNGKLIVSGIVGGAPPLQYSIDNGTTWQTNPEFDNLAPGPYPLWMLDANNTIVMAPGFTNIGGLVGATVTPTATAADCANNNGTVVVGASLGASPYTYSLDNATGPFVASNTFTGVSAGPHTAYVTDVNGCVTSATVPVPLTNTLGLTVGPDATICEGKSVTLAAVSPNGVTFAWTPAAGLSDATKLNPVVKPTTTTTYSLTATWGPCTQTGQETVIVNPAPVANAGPSDTTCYGLSVQLAGEATGGTGPYTYKWTPNLYLDNPNEAGPFAITPTSSVVYSLEVTDANGCASLNTSRAIVTVTPPPQIFAGKDTNVVVGQPVPLQAVDVLPSGFVSYSWSPAEGLTDPNAAATVLVGAAETTTFVVQGKTAQGCIGVDSVTVKVFKTADIYVPSAFSPNHDGHNDVLRVVAPSIALLKVFAVYDRWGALIFTTSNAAVGWDGTRGGQALPPGVYVWMAVGVDYQGHLVERKGTVVLVR